MELARTAIGCLCFSYTFLIPEEIVHSQDSIKEVEERPLDVCY